MSVPAERETNGQPRRPEDAALCPVCALRERDPLPARLTVPRTYRRRLHLLCSERCAEEFDSDPTYWAPPRLPRAAPSFRLRSIEGSIVRRSDLGPRALLIHVWAPWCRTCIASLPGLAALHRTYGGRRFSVVGISLETDAGRVTQALGKAAVYPNLVCPWSRHRSLSVRVIPTLLLVDARGRIVGHWEGVADMGAVESAVAGQLGQE